MISDSDGLTVAQMSCACGLSAYTLRYYERAGLIRPVARNSGGQRRYGAADIEWVRFLVRLRETGMPIRQMRHYAALRESGNSTIEPRLQLLEEHQTALKEQIARLTAHEQALADKITTYRSSLTEPGTTDKENPDG
ncbi:MAG TPA: MerR family transcriptional regulator [Propionibacteriaceae bacterium]|nr:MerR family transcriptional regulator [Propionibacteriaceae bacterium]